MNEKRKEKNIETLTEQKDLYFYSLKQFCSTAQKGPKSFICIQINI